MKPELAALQIGDAPSRWEALGFTVAEKVCEVGAVRLELGAAGEGIAGWTLRGIAPADAIDGLATATDAGERAASDVPHPNGATAIDHVVVMTPDFERTSHALESAGVPLRRITENRGRRMGFRRLGPAILELVESPEADADAARFWGLVVTVEDLDRLAERLGEQLGPVKPAIQPGRRIATLRESAGLGQAVAFMD